MKFIRKLMATLATASTLAMPFSPAAAQAADAVSPDKVRALASDLIVYGLPLVLMDTTMRQQTNVPDASSVAMRAPVNQFAHFRAWPRPDSREIVRYNFDTLYSFAWVDVSAEPVVLTVPPSPQRYYLVPVLDMWTDVFLDPGTRVTGEAGGQFAIVARGWRGELPEGVHRVEAPTPVVWVMGRVQTNGAQDFANVHKVQDGFRLTPLSQWGKAPALAATQTDPSVDMVTPPFVQTMRLDGVGLVVRLAELMKKYPPHLVDTPLLMRAAAIGFVPGQSFDASRLDAASVAAINAAAGDAKQRLQARMRSPAGRVNGWSIFTDNIGSYGSSYERRAMIALTGIGANLPEDSVYPTTGVDKEGKPLAGGQRYVLHFDKDRLPPADAFWSVTLYDMQGYQVPNEIQRFALGDRDALKFNSDGSLDLYIQSDNPGPERSANWLPAPSSGNYALTMRIYLPRPSVFSGAWQPPGVQRISVE